MVYVKENTIASLKTAATYDVGMVQFDVQLTADKIPVVFHDMFVPLAIHKRCPLASREIYQMALKDLTLKQLQSTELPRFSPETMDMINNTEERFNQSDLTPFPSLEDCFKSVLPTVGFNIVINYPKIYANGKMETGVYFDANFTVDSILKVILEHSCGRKVVLSSYSHDLCVMMSLKQNRFPVVPCIQDYEFLSFKLKETYLQATILSSQAEHFLGLNLQASQVFSCPQLVKVARKMNMTIFAKNFEIGEDIVSELLNRYGINVVISNQVDFPIPESYDRQVFEIKRTNHLIDLSSSSVISVISDAGHNNIEPRISMIHHRKYSELNHAENIKSSSVIFSK